MEIKAYGKNIKGSPRKARIVADAVRGQNAVYAIQALQYMPKGAAAKIRKVVQSAVANAVNNYNMNADELIVTRIMVDQGLVYKRMHAQSRGRGRSILKRTSNITVFVGKKGDNSVIAAKQVDSKPAQVESAKTVEAITAVSTETKSKKAPKAAAPKEDKETKVAKAKSTPKTRAPKAPNHQSRKDN